LGAFVDRVDIRMRLFRDERNIRGFIGCKLSHEKAWERIAAFPDGLYLVCEDDARPAHPGALERIRNVLAEAPSHADVVWLNGYDAAEPIRFWPRIRARLDRDSRGLRVGTRGQAALARIAIRVGRLRFRRWPPVVHITTESYLIRPAFAARLLEYTRPWFYPVDEQIRCAFEDIGGVPYIVKPALVRQESVDSDIRFP
jgi:GR25 family glycosyltransferase involved in LPS biosynthesis